MTVGNRHGLLVPMGTTDQVCENRTDPLDVNLPNFKNRIAVSESIQISYFFVLGAWSRAIIFSNIWWTVISICFSNGPCVIGQIRVRCVLSCWLFFRCKIVWFSNSVKMDVNPLWKTGVFWKLKMAVIRCLGILHIPTKIVFLVDYQQESYVFHNNKISCNLGIATDPKLPPWHSQNSAAWWETVSLG